MINFPFWTNGKSVILGVPILKHIRVVASFESLPVHVKYYRAGPGCSKLTTSLVNISLKFQTVISQKRQYFLLKIFSTKNCSVFGYKVVNHLTS